MAPATTPGSNGYIARTGHPLWWLLQLSLESLHPVADGGRYRDPWPNIGPSLLRTGRRNYRSQGGQQHGRKNKQEWLVCLMGTLGVSSNPPGGLHGTEPGPLHICDSCVTWSIYRTPGSGNRDCPWCSRWFLGTSQIPVLYYLAQTEYGCLVL